MWWGRQFNVNWVADPDFATGQNNAHDTGFADDISVRVALEGRLCQTRPNALELSAWVAQTSHRDDCRIPDAAGHRPIAPLGRAPTS